MKSALILNRFSNVKFFIFCLLSGLFAGERLSSAPEPLELWINDHLAIADTTGIWLSFTYQIISEYSEYQFPGNLVMDKDRNRFNYQLGPKSTVSDGQAWYVIDSRTEQVLIQYPEADVLQDFKYWFEADSLRALLPESTGSRFEYALKIPGIQDSIQVYLDEADSSLRQIIYPYQHSQIIISEISVHSVSPADSSFIPDTTGLFILDLRD